MAEESLNDEALRTMSEESDFITKPDEVTPSEPDRPTTMVVPSTENEIDAGTETTPEALVSSLDDTNVKLVSLEEDTVRVHELEDVNNQIMAQESIGVADAQVLAQKMGDEFKDEFPEKTFTQSPTQTNLVPVRQFVTRTKEQAQAELQAKFKEFAQVTSTQIRTAYEYLANQLVPDTLSKIQALENQFLDSKDAIIASKQFFYLRNEKMETENGERTDQTLVDVRRLTFDGCDVAFPESTELLKRLREAYHNPDASTIIRISVSSTPGESGKGDYYAQDYTYYGLMHLFEDKALEQGIKIRFETLQQGHQPILQALENSDLEAVDKALPQARTYLDQISLLVRGCIALQPFFLYLRGFVDLFAHHANPEIKEPPVAATEHLQQKKKHSD